MRKFANSLLSLLLLVGIAAGLYYLYSNQYRPEVKAVKFTAPKQMQFKVKKLKFEQKPKEEVPQTFEEWKLQNAGMKVE